MVYCGPIHPIDFKDVRDFFSAVADHKCEKRKIISRNHQGVTLDTTFLGYECQGCARWWRLGLASVKCVQVPMRPYIRRLPGSPPQRTLARHHHAHEDLMRIIYDNVYGNGMFVTAVTDALPNMLQVSRGKPGGKLCWRQVTTGRFGPFWLGSSEAWTWTTYRGFRDQFSVGSHLNAEDATKLIKRYKATLQRTGGTFFVQLRAHALGYFIAIYHTTLRNAESTNPGRPDGFPAKL